MLRTLITAAVLLIATQVQATHLIGGDLSYRHVSTSGTSSTYEVRLTLYREMTGIGLGQSQSVTVTGGGMTQTVNLSLAKAEYALSAYRPCAYPTSLRVNEFVGTVTLSNSANYTFSYSICCRPMGVVTISNSSSQEIYLEAKLNLAAGLRSYNSSAQWAPMPEIAGAVNEFQQINIPFFEKDGDSTAMVLRPALKAAGTSVTYATGYSGTTPFDSHANHPVTLDPTTGTLSFKATTAQTATVAMRLDDYVYDSTNAAWYRIGYTMREIPIYLTTGAGGMIGIDSAISSQPGVLDLYLDHPVFRGSITAGLQEFEWTQSGVTSGYASQLDASWDTLRQAHILSLHLSNAVSGAGKLIVHVASDSSTAVGRCGSALAADTHTVYLPFVSSIMLGNNSPTWMSTSTYQLSSTAMIDSITWLLSGGTWISYPATLSDPAEVQWTAATGELQAVRWGRLAADTVRIQVQVQGVGLEEGLGFSEVHAMPNPANDVLYLSAEPFGPMDIWNLFGQKVETVMATRQIPVNHLPNGSYVLCWKEEQAMHRVRFVVQH